MMIQSRPQRFLSQRGLSLIELMISLVVSMMLTLAVFAVLSTAEGRKRTTTSTNDATLSGQYALTVLEKAVRSAGGGFNGIKDEALGCVLKAARSGTQVLPAATGLPVPFDKVNPGTATAGQFLLAPVLILPGQTKPGVSGQSSDALIVMSGSGVRGDASMPTTAGATGTSLPVLNAVGVNAGDILLVVNKQLGGRPCMVTQVNPKYASDTKPIDLTGAAYTKDSIDSTPLASFGSASWVVNLGAQPQVMLFGVGANNTLFSYDLLQLTGSTQAVEVTDGVFELKALYGISTDTDNDDKFDTMEWVAPTDARFDLAAMVKDPSLMGRITAIRIGLILRTSLPEKTAVTSGPLTLFSGLSNAANQSLSYSRSLSTAEKGYRYRTLEVTVPVRNNLL